MGWKRWTAHNVDVRHRNELAAIVLREARLTRQPSFRQYGNALVIAWPRPQGDILLYDSLVRRTLESA